jgi:hypothetical protein
MKQNKAITYVLLIAVAAIWGWVIYKIIGDGGSDNTNNIIIDNNLKNDNSEMQLDTFSLIASYSDPFVIKYVSVNLAEDLNLEEEKNKANKVKPIVKWPEIIYSGTVKNKVTNRNIALVNINEQHLLLDVGDTAYQIQILNIYADSLVVSYEKELKSIAKTKATTTSSQGTEKDKKKGK